jgi:hypothetical protein
LAKAAAAFFFCGHLVVPANAGTHAEAPKPQTFDLPRRIERKDFCFSVWIPAFAGMTTMESTHKKAAQVSRGGFAQLYM